MKLSFLLLGCLWVSGVLGAVPVGVWVDEEEGAHFLVYEEEGALFMKIVELPTATEGRRVPTKDLKNPDPALRGEPLLGMVVMKDCRAAKKAGRWEGGSGYSPKEGKYCKVYLQMHGEDRLEMRGFQGLALFGKSHFFRRLEAKEEKGTGAKGN